MNESAAEAFLERDFGQCFEQLRHYDAAIWSICRFAFTAYTAILGTAVGLYQFSKEKGMDLVPVAISILLIGLVIGGNGDRFKVS